MGLNSADELVEVLSEDDNVMGIVTRQQMRAEVLRHRAVFVPVLDGHGRLLIHQRSLAKDLWPGLWDLCAGGVLAVGEDPSEAATRELAEELGLDLALSFIGRGAYDGDDARVVGDVFVGRVDRAEDAPVRFVDDEVIAASWAGRATIVEGVANGRFVPDSVHIVWPLVAADVADVADLA